MTVTIPLASDGAPPAAAPRWRRAQALSLLAVLPAIAITIMVVRHWANVLYYDHWAMVPLIEKGHAGTLSFGDFFAQHNEHRLLFPRLVMVPLAWLTGWDTRYENVVSLLLAAGAFAVLYLIMRGTLRAPLLLVASAVLASVVFFSPIQWANWLWGWQLQWFMNIGGLVTAVWTLSRAGASHTTRRVLIAAAAATVATYSLGSGMFVWLVCLPLLVFQARLRRWLPLWIGLAVVEIGAYWIGYSDPAGPQSKLAFLDAPADFAQYIVTYLVNPLLVDRAAPMRFGAVYLVVIVTCLAYLLRHHRSQLVTSLLPWLCIALYGLLSAASTAVSRVKRSV